MITRGAVYGFYQGNLGTLRAFIKWEVEQHAENKGGSRKYQ